MREIKFRAWDIKNNDWADLNSLTDWGSCEMTACIGMGNEQYPYTTFRVQDDSQFKIMQYTGIKDKNGVEIYEGDVVWTPQLKYTTAVVTYCERKGSYVIEEHKLHSFERNGSYLSISLGGLLKLTEVRGNIYQNPELLTT